MSQLRILFAGNFHWNAGSSHTLAEYAAAARRVGCEIAISTQLARMDAVVPRHLPLVNDIRWATHLALVFEGRQFLSPEQIDLCDQIPRERRVVIDPDGHWGPVARSGVDTTHGAYTPESWNDLYARLCDRVLQPRIGVPLAPGAEFFSYFGMPRIHRLATDAPAADRMAYQLQYIGSNWWRWEGIVGVIVAAGRAGPAVRRMRICGRWWNGDRCRGHERATESEPGWLYSRGVEVAPSVPFGHVVAEMSRATLTPILARPLLASLSLLTPRMFETLASGSLPIIADDLGYLVNVYGCEAAQFLLVADTGDAVARLLGEYGAYRRVLAAIQQEVFAAYNYERTLARLVALLT